MPILLQEHYRPDGWLSFLIGQLFYVNFVKHSFSQAMEMLFKEIRAASVNEKLILPSESKHGKDMISSSFTHTFTFARIDISSTFKKYSRLD